MAQVSRVLADGAVTSAKLASTVGNFGAWTAYTPALTASTTNPVISGTGAYDAGTYVKVGRLVVGKGKIQFGSTGSAGSGTYSISLPVTARAVGAGESDLVGTGFLFNGGTNAYYQVQLLQQTTTTVFLYYAATYNGAATAVASATPFAWANNMSMTFNFQYEAAS